MLGRKLSAHAFPLALSKRFLASKSSQLRDLIYSDELTFLMEAHNGLSAKIVEETGFDAIWGSGLSISASMGIRDSNEASWTQVLDNIEFMSDITKIPILLDADTGYGNFNNARRLVTKLESRNIAGMCIEDKIFPKTNSFVEDNDANGYKSHVLCDIDEFCGKIRACKDTQRNKDFMVVARLESFIAGIGLEDALNRANNYCNAGVDAILCHSKKTNSSEIESFMYEWNKSSNKYRDIPVIIVPTKYYTTNTDVFRDIGVRSVIWANHNMRACITAMKNVSAQIYKDESLVNIENDIATVNDVFELTNNQELKDAEKLYLPQKKKKSDKTHDEQVSQLQEKDHLSV